MNTSNNQNQIKIVLSMTVILSVVSILLLGIIFYFISSSKILLLQSVTHLTNNTKEIIVESNNNYIEKLLEDDKVKNIIYRYNTDFSYVQSLEDIKVSDYKKVTDSFYKSLKKEIDKDEISKTKEKIVLDEKEKKITKLSYKVKKEMLNKILSNTVDEILINQELLNSFSYVYGDGFKNNLNSYKNDLDKANYDYFYYNVYYYGFNNIVMYEIEIFNNCIQLYNYNGEERLDILEDGKVVYSLNIKG